jgi:hypothetical protein
MNPQMPRSTVRDSSLPLTPPRRDEQACSLPPAHLRIVGGAGVKSSVLVLDESGSASRGAICPGGVIGPARGRRNGRKKLEVSTGAGGAASGGERPSTIEQRSAAKRGAAFGFKSCLRCASDLSACPRHCLRGCRSTPVRRCCRTGSGSACRGYDQQRHESERRQSNAVSAVERLYR